MKKFLLAVSLILFPAVAFAQFTTLTELISSFGTLVSNATPIVFALAVLAFFWGLIIYIAKGGEEEERKKGRQFMIGGVIAITVMSLLFGIVRVLGQEFSIQDDPTINVPKVPITP